MRKSIRRIFFVITTVSVMAVGVCTTMGYAWQQEPSAQSQRDHFSRVAAAIERARASGLKQITLSSPVVMRTGVATVDDLIRDYTLLRVVVRDSTTVVSDQDVETWYKLQVLEVLNRQDRVAEEPLPKRAPVHLLPLAESNLFYVITGGTAVIDGLSVTEPFVDEGLVLQKDHQYVGGFLLEAGGQLAATAALSASLYEVSDNEDLKPRGSPEHPLVRDFRDYLGNRLTALKTTINRQVGAPRTTLK